MELHLRISNSNEERSREGNFQFSIFNFPFSIRLAFIMNGLKHSNKLENFNMKI